MTSRIVINATINGQPREFLADERDSLLDALRERIGLTGSKEGCNNGNCGACTVMLDGRLVNSCLVLAAEVEGAEVTAVEGLAHADHLSPLQEAFLEEAGSSAASARRGCSSPPKRSWTRTLTRRSTKYASGSPATSAAVPATTRSCARC